MTSVNRDILLRFKSTSDLAQTNKQLSDILTLIAAQGIAVKEMGNQYSKQTATMSAYYDKAVANQNKLVDGQKQVVSGVTEANKKIATQTEELKKVGGSIDQISGGLANFQRILMAAFTISQLKTFTSEVIAAKTQIDFFKTGLDNIVESERAVNMVYADVVRLAKTSPFTVEDLTKVTLRLSAMGVETANLIPTIEALGNASAIVGSEKLPLIAKAYTDVMNKGILMKQEINQFSENGIPIYNMLADSMHKTREEVIKMAEAHKISFADIEKAFKVAGQEGGTFYGMMATQAKTLGGQVSNLKDTFTLAQARIGDFFEKTLKGGISTMTGFIDSLAGSDSALKRTVDGVKTLAAAYGTYLVVVKGAAIAEELAATWLIAKTAATKAAQAVQGAYNLLMITATGSTEAFTSAQIRSAAAFKASFSPIGALLTVIGVLTTAYYAFKTATDEVVSSLGEEEIKIKNQKAAFETATTSVMALKEGTEERRIAMENLIRQYPEYFSGLSAEVANNATLSAILKTVNANYENRIDLARQAYKIEQLESKRTEFLREEEDLMKRITMRSPELAKQVGGDATKLFQLFEKNGKAYYANIEASGNAAANFFNDLGKKSIYAQAKNIAEGLKEIDKELLEASNRRTQLTEKEKNSAIAAENLRWQKVAASMKKGSKEYEIEHEEHEKRIRNISGETVKAKLDGDDKVKKSKKTVTELALENDLKELKSMQQTYAVKMQIINTQEKLDKERAKRQIDNVEAENARILSIEKEANNKRGKLALEFATEQLSSLKAWLDEQVNQHKKKDGKINALREVEKWNIEQHQKKIAQLDHKLSELQENNNEKRIKQNREYYATLAADEGEFWGNREEKYLEATIRYNEIDLEAMKDRRKALEDQATAIQGSLIKQEEYKKILIEIAELTGKITDAERKNFEDHERLIQMKIAKGREYFSIALQFVGNLARADYEAMESSWDAATEAVDNFYDYAMEANKRAFEFQLENSKNSLADMALLFDSYAERQRMTLESKQSFDLAAANMKNIIQNMKEVDENMNKFTQLLSEGKYFAAVVNGIANIFQTKKRLAEDEKEMRRLEMEQTMDKYDQELALVDQWLQIQQKAFRDAYDAKVELINKEIEAEQAKYAKLKEESEAFYSANQNRLKEDDVYRAQLMAAGEQREVELLERQKELLIAEANRKRDALLQEAKEKGATESEMAAISMKTAEEVARITNAFNKLIADTHKEYQDAQGNVTKETSLANQEVKAQEADSVSEIEWNLNGALDELRTKLYDAQVEMQRAMVAMQQNAANVQIEIERQKWEAMRAFAIAELKAAAKVALGKGNPKGHAIAMSQVIELENMENPFNGMGGVYTINAPGIPGSSRPPGPRSTRPRNNPGGSGTTVDAGGDSSPGSPDRPGRDRPLYHGTEWLRTETGASFTRDGIIAHVHEGERIIPYINNLMLLQKVGKISNEELVAGYIRMKEREKKSSLFGDAFDYKGMNGLSGINSMMDTDYSRMIKSGAAGSMTGLDKLADAVNALAKKPGVNVTVTPRRITTEEMSGNTRTIYENSFSKNI